MGGDSGLAIPLCGFGIVLPNTFARVMHQTEIKLGNSIPLLGGLAAC